ncbi:hypothetical protein WGP40_05535 [Brachymonas sp. G13]|uniref:hypothetical protein n=1 Tax=Brachymonas wangyanguii TaxID=3130163 RepID=UPI00307E2C21
MNQIEPPESPDQPPKKKSSPWNWILTAIGIILAIQILGPVAGLAAIVVYVVVAKSKLGRFWATVLAIITGVLVLAALMQFLGIGPGVAG